jgi:hypothetical protein
MAACSSEPERRDVTDIVWRAFDVTARACKEVGGAFLCARGAPRRRWRRARAAAAAAAEPMRQQPEAATDLLCIEQRRTTTSRLRELYLLHS